VPAVYASQTDNFACRFDAKVVNAKEVTLCQLYMLVKRTTLPAGLMPACPGTQTYSSSHSE